MDTHGTAGPAITDWGRLQSARVRQVANPQTEEQLVELVRNAARTGAPLSIRGVAHSAGGQSFAPDSVVIEMRGLARVLAIDEAARTIRVQAGASWGDITPLLESRGLAVTTKQEFDTFTIGGSIAANVHGKSVDYGPLIESVQSLRLLKADGQLVNISRQENAELFPAVIGGYGLLGAVVDVTLNLVRDRPVRKAEVVLNDVTDLCRSYDQRVQPGDNRPALCYGFLDRACEQGFYVTYAYADGAPRDLGDLKRAETPSVLFDLFVWMQRHFSFVQRRSFGLMWMGSGSPETTLRSRRLLLWDRPPHAFDKMLLQKYFIPKDRFCEFAQLAGRIFSKYPDLLLLTNHFRFVPGNSEALLSFAPQDSICMIPCYLADQGTSGWVARLTAATNELVEAALSLNGRHYLAFDILATPEQVRRAYPRFGPFLELKRLNDPAALFRSMLYDKYAC
jgi:decaprenylphospho-beta-D-ribofuranose 2-oxidase